ncbi:unnamed protein product [Cercopithifilaria johnstoni]|uniref:Uncharacterized protein n=1 Tax=Cercopithifilaria johnstoni TaxID=2874296 RepID=A0A8J2M572_9BILA|nr:unnamed protein product [Cercopithifilaria johnstoni]
MHNRYAVVEKIKENPLQCELVVISEENLAWYERNNTALTLSLPDVWSSQQKKLYHQINDNLLLNTFHAANYIHDK